MLTELQGMIADASASRFKMIEATNRFYSLIPHDFGSKPPTMIDNEAVRSGIVHFRMLTLLDSHRCSRARSRCSTC